MDGREDVLAEMMILASDSISSLVKPFAPGESPSSGSVWWIEGQCEDCLNGESM